MPDDETNKKKPRDPNHPNGITLMLRDTPGNHKVFPQGPFGYLDVADSVCTPDGKCPHYHYTEDDAQQQEQQQHTTTPIHILIASFRDRLSPLTLDNAFKRAQNPTRM